MASIHVERRGIGPQIAIHIDLDPEDNSVAGRVLAMGRTNIVFEFELARHPELTYGTEALFEFRDEDERYWPRPTLDHNIRVEASRIFVDREDDLLNVVMDRVLTTAAQQFGSVLPGIARLAHVAITVSLIERPRHKTAWQHLLEDDVPCPKP